MSNRPHPYDLEAPGGCRTEGGRHRGTHRWPDGGGYR